MSLTPRWYQTAANEAVWKYLNEKSGNPVVVLPTGAGKSLLIALLIKQALEFGGRVVVLAHRKELLQQNADEIRGMIPGVDVGVYSAGLKKREIHNAVVVAGIQSVFRKADDLGRRHLILVDECFVGETIIDTPMGQRRIDNMRCGDTVYCSGGIGVVKSVSSRPSPEIYTVELSNGEVLRCTGDHPIFTERGWKKVREVATGEVLFSKQAVCEMWRDVHAIQKKRIRVDGKSIQTAEVLLSILCEEIEKPNEQSSNETEGECHTSRTNAQTYQAWRERAIASLGSACDSSRSRGGVGIRSGGRDRTAERDGISNCVQNRCCTQGKENRNRTRRRKPLHSGEKITRCKENEFSGIIRVVNISSEKRESPIPVFNLHVSGHPSYFANGVLVHNCHLISDIEESMYRRFLDDMQKQEGLRIPGLTATAFRTGTGPICGPDRIFQRIVYEAKTSQLIAEGFLCPITNKVATAEVNTDSVPLKGGEFVESEMQAVFGVEDTVVEACKEIVAKCHDRHSILVFASGVSHAEDVAVWIEKLTMQSVAVVTGDTLPIERAETLRRFVAGELRFLVNVDVLTTGFNAKCVDAIAILRATMSPGLFCQMVGRGLRLHEKKTNTLLLDFGGNIARHGSIDDENFGASEERSGGKRGEVAAQNGRGKKCPACELDVAANARSCPECEFIFPVKHEAKADDESQVTGAMPPEEWIVKDVVYRVHLPKRGADEVVTPSVRMDYVVSKTDEGGNLSTTTIAEWICPQHSGFARNKFLAWWDAHSICEPPDSAEDCVELMKLGTCRWPAGIVTKKKGKWFEIVEHKFVGEKPTTLAEVEDVREFSGVEDDVPF